MAVDQPDQAVYRRKRDFDRAGNLILIARLRHLNNPRQVADDLLKRFGLTDAADRRVSAYSGGLRRRLDIAMSLVGKQQLIFLDEPTTGLDPEARLEVWKTVKELAANGTTVFLTTQYLEEAEQLADRIAILHEGRIIANGTLARVRRWLLRGTGIAMLAAAGVATWVSAYIEFRPQRMKFLHYEARHSGEANWLIESPMLPSNIAWSVSESVSRAGNFGKEPAAVLPWSSGRYLFAPVAPTTVPAPEVHLLADERVAGERIDPSQAHQRSAQR